MSNYIPKTKIRWIATRCTSAACKAKDHAVDFVLKSGHVPKCEACGSPMTFKKGDLKNDPS